MQKMEDHPENALKNLCCTCLSKDRKLLQLCRLNDGVNNLYTLLSYDSEAFKEGFYKDSASFHICWECEAVMRRISTFRRQACKVQKLLSEIVDGQTHVNKLNLSLSRLQIIHKSIYDDIITDLSCTDNDTTVNFIDCGPATDIKTEDDLDDIPLSELHNNYISDSDSYQITDTVKFKDEIREKVDDCYENLQTLKKKNKIKLKSDDFKKCFVSKQMCQEEMEVSRENRKTDSSYVAAEFKCESCIQVFRRDVDLEKHNLLHVEKPNHIKCDICHIFTGMATFGEHRLDHYTRHGCTLCDHETYSEAAMEKHLKQHGVQKNIKPVRRKKGERKTAAVLKPGSKPRRNQVMLDKRTPYGYLCTECDKYFENKNQRWKHVQRHHREGFKCATCGKRFAFKNNLTRHELVHQGPPPREPCPICHKMIRKDLTKIHARIHSVREQFSCVECDKTFVSRASYEHHLKYTQAHANRDILKYKCSLCEKGYRSRGELRDHVNYQHMGKTRHQCPICNKALATRRCIRRHVRRAHDGVQEAPRDKMCQQCGKAFRDKKGLREHESIHTGERPLSCEVCGGSFRQSASLYTHRKRVHHIYPARRHVVLDDHTTNTEPNVKA